MREISETLREWRMKLLPRSVISALCFFGDVYVLNVAYVGAEGAFW